MKTWSKCCTGMAAIASLTPSLWAQAPAPPAVPAAPAAPAVIQVVPAPPPKKTLLEQCAQMKANCKQALCQSPLGALLNGALAPVTAFSGGIVPPLCPPTPSAADLAKPPGSAEGAAAAIKKAEAEAKARRAAVRYLGTVDCHWFPEAEIALVNSLRADTNECVRLEAALALGRGCCCTKKTIAALDITVSGSNKDGKPSENSERVKAVAYFALQHCLACFSETVEPITEQPKLPIEPPSPAKPALPVEKPTAMIDVTPSPYYKALDNVPLKQVVEKARRTLDGGVKVPVATQAHRSDDHSLYGLFTKAMNRKVVGEETASSQPTSLAGWLNSRSSASAVAVPAMSVSAVTSEPKPTPVVQPVASAAAVQTVSTAGTLRAEERCDPEFPVAGATKVTVKQLLTVLRKASLVAQREWAADNLAKVNWQENPVAAETLVKSAREDSAPTVRQACVRSLVKMGVFTPSAIAVFKALKADADDRVRLEAEAALRNRGCSQPEPSSTVVLPGGAAAPLGSR